MSGNNESGGAQLVSWYCFGLGTHWSPVSTHIVRHLVPCLYAAETRYRCAVEFKLNSAEFIIWCAVEPKLNSAEFLICYVSPSLAFLIKYISSNIVVYSIDSRWIINLLMMNFLV